MVVKNIVNQSPSSSVLSKVVFFVSFFVFTPSIAYLYYTDYNITKNLNELEKQDKESGCVLQDVIAIVSNHSNDIKDIDCQLTGAVILISEQDAKLKTQSNDLKSLNNELFSLRDQMNSLVKIDQYNNNLAILGNKMSKFDSEIKNINDKINGLSQVSSIPENINTIGDGVLISDKSTQSQDVKENENTYLKDDLKVNSTSGKNTEGMKTAYASNISADANYSSNSNIATPSNGMTDALSVVPLDTTSSVSNSTIDTQSSVSNSDMNTTLSSVGNDGIESQSNTETLSTIKELNGRVDVLSKEVSDIKEKMKTYDENYGKFKEDFNTLNGRIDDIKKDISESAMSTSSPNYSWSIGCCNNSSFHLRRSASNKRAWFSFLFFKEPIFVFSKYCTKGRGNDLPNTNQSLSDDNSISALFCFFKLIELNVMNNSFLGVRVSLLSPILPYAFKCEGNFIIINEDLFVLNVNLNLFSYIGLDIYFRIDELLKEYVGIVHNLCSGYKGVLGDIVGTKGYSCILGGSNNCSICTSICLV